MSIAARSLNVLLQDRPSVCLSISMVRTHLLTVVPYQHCLFSVTPVISTGEPSLYEVEEGRDVTLQCSTLSAKPYVTWQWSYNGKPAINTVQRNFGRSGILTIQNVTTDDGGQYECTGYQGYSKRKVGRRFMLTVIGQCDIAQYRFNNVIVDSQYLFCFSQVPSQ